MLPDALQEEESSADPQPKRRIKISDILRVEVKGELLELQMKNNRW